MNPKILFGKIDWILLIFIAFATQLLLVEQGLYAEEPSASNSSSATNASVVLEKKIYQLVKDLEYSDKVAQDFVKMVRPWGCDVLYQKLYQAAQDVKEKKISWSQYAQVEEELVNKLSQKIQQEIAIVDTTVKTNLKYVDLALVIKDKKTHCLGYAQLFYILGSSVGLTVQAANVVKHFNGQMYPGTGHAACAVGLHNGKAMQVDLTLRDYVNKEFIFTEKYEKAGNYWNLRDKNNHLNIHPSIQLLDRRGLVSAIYNNRGHIYTNAGDLSEAITDCTKAIKLNPKFAEAYINRGNSYCKLGKLTEAISDFDNAIELNPNDPQSYYNRGTAYGKLGKLTEAISNFNKAIELNPKFAEAYYNRGKAYGESTKLSEAISDFNKAIELNPKDARAYYNRGALYHESGKLTQAISDFNKAIALNPKYAEAYLGRGVTYIQLGKREDAKKDLRKAMQLNPGLKDQVKKVSDQLKLNL
ncbi:MAG TPA: tetratricopeptide repeat protein [Thermoguttaceae bacterium]